MKKNDILKELVGAPQGEQEEDFDDNIFHGTDAYQNEDTDFFQEENDSYGITERGKYRVSSAFVNDDLDEAYQGKAISRSSASKDYSNSIDIEEKNVGSSSEIESDDESDDYENEDMDNWDIGNKTRDEGNLEGEDGEEQDEDEKESGGSDASSIEDDLESNEEGKVLAKDFDVYSKGSKSVTDDKKKGSAILSQQELWESLLENRIILQKCLVAANKLPAHHEFPVFQAACKNEFSEKMSKCCDSLCQVLEKFLKFQNKLLDSCSDYKKTSKIKREAKDTTDPTETSVKKRKLNEYEDLLSEQHEDYKTYRNSEIQKWNDRTKVSSGKFSSSNFSAFDLPTLKQIEQILSDRSRLVRRTQTKRSQYKIISLSHQGQEEDDEETNPEIFDDDDFYHKLLRDLIERKSGDVTDPTRLGKQWIQLQKLRSKMKKKVDTRASKGRKLRFVVHPKLVNFMAPVETEEINEEAAKELFSSLFGKIKA